MAQINISESVGRALYYAYFDLPKDYWVANLSEQTPAEVIKDLPESGNFVVKPDHTISKRGKNNLMGINLNKEAVGAFLQENKEREFNGLTLTRFIIAPFVAHKEEYYVSLATEAESDVLTYSLTGGVDIEENWASTQKIAFPVQESGKEKELLLAALPERPEIVEYFAKLLAYFREYGLVFLEINPFVQGEGSMLPLDFKGRLDSTALFHLQKHLDIYALLDQESGSSPEETTIKQLDASTGASLKLKLLNRNARVWPMIAGGGASIIYFDALVNLGLGAEIGFYGEYSGNPTFELTYVYAKTVVELLLASTAQQKVLIIAGANANFTDIVATFKGIIKILQEHAKLLQEQKVLILVRRGGPNVEEALQMMADLGKKLSLDIQVEGVEHELTHILRHIPLES